MVISNLTINSPIYLAGLLGLYEKKVSNEKISGFKFGLQEYTHEYLVPPHIFG